MPVLLMEMVVSCIENLAYVDGHNEVLRIFIGKQGPDPKEDLNFFRGLVGVFCPGCIEGLLFFHKCVGYIIKMLILSVKWYYNNKYGKNKCLEIGINTFSIK